jgi:sigma-E factor negative regulatory protein RseC
MNKICHEGIIKNINENKVEVSVISASACASCHSKGLCNLSEIQEKTIDVESNNPTQFNVGDKVNIYMTRTMGNKAVFIGYFLPFIVMMTIIIVLAYFNISELIIGLSTLGVVAVYYFILYLFKNKINKQFSFSVKKISE